jgi:hypothetical protein
MFEDAAAVPGIQVLVHYLHRPEIHVAVVLPGLASLTILGWYARRGLISDRLQLLWMLALGISYYCARWVITPEFETLYIYSAFSIVCALLLFNRVYVPPALAFALTFLALWWVDVAHALCRALECNAPIDRFFLGVGGAGLRDGLLLVPIMTALALGYGALRIRAGGEKLSSL